MIDWSEGFSAAYQVCAVDPVTWNDVSWSEDTEILPITGGTISRNDSDLRQSADISTVNVDLLNERWVRVYLIARQGQNVERTAIFTGLATSPSSQYNGRIQNASLQCYSVLKPAADVLLKRGWYAAKGMRYYDVIEQLVDPIFAPVTIEATNATITDHIIAESNESHLSMLDSLLLALNWRLKIYGDGSIYIGPYSTEPIVTFDSRFNDMMEQSFTVTNDWYACPNVLRVVYGDQEYIEYDHSDSLYSIENRGREVWAEEANPDISSGENLEFYAKRRLAELQENAVKISYSRAYNPFVQVSDVVRLNYPMLSIFGNYYVGSQSITIGQDSKTSEEVVQL